MAYSELVKSFERIRNYMREFYVYGFKSRDEYGMKSARSYDNERRRIESWLGDYMSFHQESSGKKVFLSMDSRRVPCNPLYKAFKAKSFTDKDITLHFYSPLMFWCPRTNGYWSPDSLRHLHKQMLAAAGVDESVRFHDLRHTFSTLAIQSGVDAKTVAGMLGHYSAAFTLDTYTHVTEQMKRGAAEKIGVFMNASVNVQVNVVHSPSAVVRGDYESDLANCLNPSNSTDLDPTSQ